MAKIYLDYLIFDKEFTKNISQLLQEKGHEIVSHDIEIGSNIRSSLKSIINLADIFIVFISNKSLESKIFYNELIQLKNYSSHSVKGLFVPIYLPELNMDLLPESLRNIAGIKLTDFKQTSISDLIIKIDETINLHIGKNIAYEEQAVEIKQKVESNAPSYIELTLKELSKRESKLNTQGQVWYMLGYLSLLTGVGAAIWITRSGVIDISNSENWSLTIFFAIKSVLILILLISASKYAFNLGKSFMNESLKNSDRIHAISFGKFYLQIFNHQIKPQEIKEIFHNWNIESKSTFSLQDSNDFDPKLLEKMTSLIEKVQKK